MDGEIEVKVERTKVYIWYALTIIWMLFFSFQVIMFRGVTLFQIIMMSMGLFIIPIYIYKAYRMQTKPLFILSSRAFILFPLFRKS